MCQISEHSSTIKFFGGNARISQKSGVGERSVIEHMLTRPKAKLLSIRFVERVTRHHAQVLFH